MGSEMCIRDSNRTDPHDPQHRADEPDQRCRTPEIPRGWQRIDALNQKFEGDLDMAKSVRA